MARPRSHRHRADRGQARRSTATVGNATKFAPFATGPPANSLPLRFLPPHCYLDRLQDSIRSLSPIGIESIVEELLRQATSSHPEIATRLDWRATRLIQLAKGHREPAPATTTSSRCATGSPQSLIVTTRRSVPTRPVCEPPAPRGSTFMIPQGSSSSWVTGSSTST